MNASKKTKRFGAVIALIAMLLVILLSTSALAAYLGDVDQNGKVQATDARKILRHAAKVEMFTDAQALFLADIDGNGKIAAADARRALRMASKLDPLIEAAVDEPTTEAPTTEAPTTEAPTTEAPTTEAPTTEAPTTEAPKTEAPTTEAPITEAPMSESPTTEAPTAEAPVSEEPTTEAPATEEPTTEAPTTEEPTTEAPTTEIVFGDWKELNENEHQRVCVSDPSIVETAAHTWDNGEITVKAGCETDGEKTYTCKGCGAVKVEPIPATGHAYGDWTELDENEHQRVCANDASHVETAAHKWNKGKVTGKAGCETDGEKTYTCKVCGAVKAETMPAIGHAYGDWTELNENEHQRV